jgi:REP element-mobilizing transposase RayT
MTRPLRIEYPGAYYHVTSRGNERKNIFVDNKDRDKFLSYLRSAYLRYGAVIHVFCLMNNHYHLFLETPKGNLSQIMRHINGAYTNYFNIRHKRRGHLLQGRYKAIIVEADSYAGELSRYIHLNPVRAGIVDEHEKFSWSSYQYYIGKKKRPEWLTVDFILCYFDNDNLQARKRYQEFVNARINIKSESPLEKTVASTILGSDTFIELIKDKYLDRKKKDRNLPALKELMKSPNIAETYKEVEAFCNSNASLTKKITLYLFHKYRDKPLKEIGTYFGIGESAVSESSRHTKRNQINTRTTKFLKNVDLTPPTVTPPTDTSYI